MLRNEELRRAALGYLLLSAAAVAAGFWLDVRCGVLVLCFSAAAGLWFWRTAQQRYRRQATRPLEILLELHDITLSRDIPPEASLCVDPVWLAEALQNLLKNCAEHTPDGGKIDIICKDNPLYTGIVLHDSGSGFAPEDLPHLFERFYRGSTDDSTGYGIGLALCRSIVLRQGGTILAKNHPQGGAMFQLRFEKQPQK